MHYLENDMSRKKLIIVGLENEYTLNRIPFQEACCCHCPTHNSDSEVDAYRTGEH